MSTPYQTTKTELDEFCRKLYPYFVDYIRQKATRVDSVEVYDPADYDEFRDRVKSLPARYEKGGVKKTVLVPVEILSRDAKEAAEGAIEATNKANQATHEANLACDNANLAATEADNARQDLEQIKSQTIAAGDAANRAANEANIVANELRKTNSEAETAEELREQAFRTALSRFDSSLTEFDGFTLLAKKAWDEFVAKYEKKQSEIESAEKKRVAAEDERVKAEAKRAEDTQKALTDVEKATERFNTLCDNPPKLDGDPPTWRFYDEESKEYKDSGITAQFPELYTLTEEMWKELMSESGGVINEDAVDNESVD